MQRQKSVNSEQRQQSADSYQVSTLPGQLHCSLVAAAVSCRCPCEVRAKNNLCAFALRTSDFEFRICHRIRQEAPCDEPEDFFATLRLCVVCGGVVVRSGFAVTPWICADLRDLRAPLRWMETKNSKLRTQNSVRCLRRKFRIPNSIPHSAAGSSFPLTSPNPTRMPSASQ